MGGDKVAVIRANRYEELLKLAKEGDAEAQNILGAILITGDYCEKDIAGGFYWYCQAIKKGCVHAKWNAGSMLIDGDDGIEKKRALGLQLIEDAANANQNSACLFMAQCYVNGLYGLEINIDKAKFYENKASDYKNAIDYNEPIDLEKDHNLKIKRPNNFRINR